VQIERIVHCPADPVGKTLALCQRGGRSALRRRRSKKPPSDRRTLAWQEALARAMEQRPCACGVPRLTWCVHHQAEEELDYDPKEAGSKLS
jgi:hypothetical protein